MSPPQVPKSGITFYDSMKAEYKDIGEMHFVLYSLAFYRSDQWIN